MNAVIFHDGTRLDTESIRGNYADGREAPTIAIPEANADYGMLKALFLNADATQTISVEYTVTSDGGELTTQRNVQTGYVVPVSLAYDGKQYRMTLGKHTADELAKDRASVSAVAAATAQAERLGALSQQQAIMVMTSALQSMGVAPSISMDEGTLWMPGEYIGVGAVRKYGDTLYECLQAHIIQTAWTRNLTPALWRVKEGSGVTVWRTGVAYKVGDIREHSGVLYRCTQGHTSQTGWEPSNVPALWVKA